MLCGRRGCPRASPISSHGLPVDRCGKLLDGHTGPLALGRREVVAPLDPAKLTAKPRERAAVARCALCSACLFDHVQVLLGDARLHRGRYLALLRQGRWRGGPDRRFAAGLDYLIGDPLELLAVAAIERQANEAVEELRDAEPLQLAPHGEARGGWLAGKPVGEQHPIAGPGHGLCIAQVRNRGYTAWCV